MKDTLYCKPIGYIHSPYTDRNNTPRYYSVKPEVEAILEIEDEYLEGIKSMEVGEQYMVLFWFHKSEGYDLTVRIHGDGPLKGVFSSHSPNRPNPIGVSIITITGIEGNNIHFTGVDMLDGTPVLDIKSGRV